MLTPVRMPGEWQKPRTRAVQLPKLQPDPSRIAVLLNKNARKVTDDIVRAATRVVGSDHVFVSKSLDEAEAMSREIVQRGYGTVVCGGGDGTLARAVNLVYRYVEEANNWRMERYRRFGEAQNLIANPRFAFLKLGTGNGMSGVVGSGKPMDDLKNIANYVPGRTHKVPLIEMDGERFFFAGVGYDSQILDDYNHLKARAQNWLLKALMQNVTGYLAALLFRTAPRLVFGTGEKLEGRVTTLGRAFYIDPRRGDSVVELEPGTTLFEGRAKVISCGTTPFFGYGFRMYPFAQMMPGMMQLRIGTTGPLRGLANIGALWQGSFRHPSSMWDFFVENIKVELDHPFPFQHSGDAQGLRDRLDLKLADDTLELVDLYRPWRMG
jgi:diacylglycerol kinase family enzyme